MEHEMLMHTETHSMYVLKHTEMFSLSEKTPPLDREEENEESRLLEVQSCKELENEGCPPCYPPDLDISLQNIPRSIER